MAVADAALDAEFVAPFELVDDSLWELLHAASRLLLVVAVVVHVGFVVRHTFIHRNHMIRRML